MTNASYVHAAGDVLRFTRIELVQNPGCLIPTFRFVGVNLSEQGHPGFVITKSHFNTYEGVLRGGDRQHHSADGNKKVYATQLPFGYFDDANVDQMLGDRVRRGILDMNGIFQVVRSNTIPMLTPCTLASLRVPSVLIRAANAPSHLCICAMDCTQAQFSVAFSRFTDPNGINIVALGRFARPLEGGDLEIDWEAIKQAIRVHPRALVYWHDIGELPREFSEELEDAQVTITDINTRASAVQAAFGAHGGQTSNYGR